MKKVQIDQYDMILSVENHFDDNPAIWAGNAPLAATKTLFSQKINRVAEQVALQLINPTGITIDKANVRKELENQAYSVSSKISAYAAIFNKADLYKRVHFSKSDFVHFRGAELVGIITNLHQEAVLELPNLAPYAINAATLASLKATTIAFGSLINNPTEAIARRKSATDSIAVMLPEIIEMLETRFDNLIVSLQETQPQFAAIYFNVRALKRTQVHPLSLTVTVVDAITKLPVPNATIQILGQRITRLSSQRGYNRVRHLAEGMHSIRANHPDFITLDENFTIVSGETTALVLFLERNP